jgi:hypothetical protein
MPDKGGSKEPPQDFALAGWAGSVVLKSFPALFAFPYAVRRWWRPILLCAGAVAVLSLPYFALHPADLKWFIHLNFSPLAPRVHYGTLGTAGLIRMIGEALPGGSFVLFSIGNHHMTFGHAVIIAVSWAVILLTLWATWRYGRVSDMNVQITLWTLAFFITYKDIWESHYVMLLPIVTAIGLSSRSRFVLWMGILFAIPTPYVLLARPDRSLSDGANWINHVVKPIPTIGLYAWALREMVRSGKASLTAAASSAGVRAARST